MNISDLFKGEHGMIDESKLIPLWGLTGEQLESINLSEEKLEEICDVLEADDDFLFFDPNGGINPYCYWDGIFYFRFMSLNMEYVGMSLGKDDFTLAKQFIYLRDKFISYRDEEKWSELVSYSDKKVSLLVFEGVRSEIPLEEQKELFLSEYRRNEYGFDRLSPEMVQEVLRLPSPKDYDIGNYKGQPDKDDYFIIYRGVTPKSSPLNKAYSWTLSEETARFFANRFESSGKILKRKVYKDNIQAYLGGRGEEEVLVLPEDIESIEL